MVVINILFSLILISIYCEGTEQNLLNFVVGDVFVVYYRDKNSKSLPKENLYNTKLYSIEKQTVLSRLRSKGRVFSVYDTFHPQQVQMLKSCLKWQPFSYTVISKKIEKSKYTKIKFYFIYIHLPYPSNKQNNWKYFWGPMIFYVFNICDFLNELNKLKRSNNSACFDMFFTFIKRHSIIVIMRKRCITYCF